MHFHNTMDQRCVLVSCPDLGTAGQLLSPLLPGEGENGSGLCASAMGGWKPKNVTGLPVHLLSPAVLPSSRHGEEGAADWLFKA